jgi:hypothetical protein
MKLHLTILTIILFSITTGFSQNNNLQFNKALYSEVSQTFPNTPNDGIPLIIGTIIVPVGKVWKIESTSGFTMISMPNYEAQNFLINNLLMNSEKPIWLPAGTHTIKKLSSSGGIPSSVSFTFIYSGIEFNLVP